jgi:hypothetical protein
MADRSNDNPHDPAQLNLGGIVARRPIRRYLGIEYFRERDDRRGGTTPPRCCATTLERHKILTETPAACG